MYGDTNIDFDATSAHNLQALPFAIITLGGRAQPSERLR